jgi:hypothetical protein
MYKKLIDFSSKKMNLKIIFSIYVILLCLPIGSCRKEKQSLPTILTNPVELVTPTSAESGGSIFSDGGSIIIDKGVCWNLDQNPTIDNAHISKGEGNGRFKCNITGLLSDTKYYLRSYAVNNTGISYGEEINFNTDSFRIGLFYEGGKIFYIDSSGVHGLIAALSDYQSSVPWYVNSFIETLAMGNDIGEGKLNTARIVNVLGVGMYAAYVCYSLSLNGYHDWYLPSFGELSLMYFYRDTIGGFENEYYWSSTQSKNFDLTRLYWLGPKALNFLNGDMVRIQGILDLYRVRPIRSF